MTEPLRIVFAGTPSFAAVHLQALLDWPRAKVVAVYSQPDRPAGRGKKMAISPVKELALRHNLPVLQPQTLRNAEAQAELRVLQPDIMVVVAYGLILPAAVLNTPRLGCINVHASILPRWRGAAPIQRAIEAGDRETGVTIMHMDEGLDTGAMLTIARCAIAPDETAGTLHEKLAQLGAPALLETLQQLATNRAAPQQQDNSLSCYAAKITKEEAALNWQKSAFELERRIRAFNPNPIAYGTLLGERIKIYRALAEHTTHTAPGVIIRADRDGILVGCGENSSLRISHLQLAGGKPLSANEVLNGRAELFKAGNRFDA
ncbi:MAG TPA: methionyl-tRNA formyltransferase [Spongiibacteraceae bacterium]|jgi:methionyl-tRNA formyltransferase